MSRANPRLIAMHKVRQPAGMRVRPFDAVVDWNFFVDYQCEQSCAGKSTLRFCLCSSPFPF